MKRGHKIAVNQHHEQYDPQGTPDFPLEAYFTDLASYPNNCVPLHWHQQVELLTVYNGAVTVMGKNYKKVFLEGQGCFINSNILHGLFPYKDYECQLFDIVFNPSLLKNDFSSYNHQFIDAILLSRLHIQPLFNSTQNQLIERIFQSSRHKRETMKLEIITELNQFWLNFFIQHQILFKPKQQSNESLIINSALSYITEHYAEPLTVKRVSQSIGISSRTCYRIFQESLETTPHQYILNYRTIQAAQLLKTTKKPIIQIAFDTGFTSSNYFISVFKHYYQMTPKKYRISMRTIPLNDRFL